VVSRNMMQNYVLASESGVSTVTDYHFSDVGIAAIGLRVDLWGTHSPLRKPLEAMQTLAQDVREGRSFLLQELDKT